MADSVCPTEHGEVCRLVEDSTSNEWLARASDWLIAKPLSILVLLVIGVVARWLLHRAIDKLTQRAADGAVSTMIARGRVSQLFVDQSAAAVDRRRQRSTTMGGLLKSIATGVVGVIVAFMVVAQLGYNIAPLIASAGIIGVALGFGAQSLVKDFLSGIFVILEDQYGVGDVVSLGTTASGTVEAVGLRVTRLRAVDGAVWYVRNGEILAVANMSQDWARTVLDVPVASSQDLGRVRGLLRDVTHGAWEDPGLRQAILEEPEVWEMERWGPDGVVMQVVLKTAPQQQAVVAREVRKRVKERFDAEGLDISMP